MTLQRISFWLLWTFIFTVPWENLLLISSHTPVSTLTAVAALSVAAIGIITRGSIRLSRLHGALAAFVVLGGASTLWSLDTGNSLVHLVTLFSLLGVSVAIFDSARDERDVRLLMLAYVLGCMVSVGGGLQSFLEHARYAGGSADRFVVDGFDPNDMAVTLAIGIPFSIYLSLVSRQLWKVLLCAGSVGGALLGIGLTASRGGAIAAALGLTSLAAVFRRDVPFSKKLVVATLFLAFAAFAVQVVPISALDRILTIRDQMSGGDFTGRKQIWKGGGDQFAATPILGVGSGAFPDAMAQRIGNHIVAHNTFLTVAVELGIVGVLLMLLIAAIAFSEYRLLPRIEQWIWFGALAAWGAGAFSLTWDYHKPTWIVATLFAAHCAVAAQRPVNSPSAPAESVLI